NLSASLSPAPRLSAGRTHSASSYRRRPGRTRERPTVTRRSKRRTVVLVSQGFLLKGSTTNKRRARRFFLTFLWFFPFFVVYFHSFLESQILNLKSPSSRSPPSIFRQDSRARARGDS